MNYINKTVYFSHHNMIVLIHQHHKNQYYNIYHLLIVKRNKYQIINN